MTLLLLACSPEPALPSASPAITAERLRATVEVLASDAMNGREALTPGNDAARRWLLDAVEPLGLEPLPGHDALTVPFPLYRQGWDVAGSEILVGEHRFVPIEGFAPLALSGAGHLDAPVVFAGYGITAEEHGWDDYAGLDVAGRWVLVLRHEPGETDPESPFDGKSQSRYATFAVKADTARAHGAAGMLLVTDPLHHQGPEDLRPPQRLSLEPPDVDEAPEEPPFLAIHVGRALADTLVASSGRGLEDLQRAVDGGTPPADLALGEVRARGSLPSGGAYEEVAGQDILAVLPGTDRADEWVVVGAHFDHEGGFAGDGHADTIYNGADDNASGSATALALARALAAREEPPRRTVVFAWFDAEEQGLLGSRAALMHGYLPDDRVVAMLNFDMVGRNPAEPVQIHGDAYNTGAREVLAAAAKPVGLHLRAMGTDYRANSDYHPFYERDIPFLGFFTGTHEDYHQPGDEADKLDYEHMERIGRVGYAVLEALADARWTPAFLREIPWLGITLRLEGRHGQRTATVAEVAASGRGHEAGIREGDVVVAVEAPDLGLGPGVGAALRDVPAGSPVTVDVQRDGEPARVVVERVKIGYMGIRSDDIDDETREAHGLLPEQGLAVGRVVPEGPSAAAGLREGDLVVALDGVPVGYGTLHASLERIGAGATVDVSVVREGERIVLPLALGERPPPPGEVGEPTAGETASKR